MAPGACPADNPGVQADRMAAGGAQDTSIRPGAGALLLLGAGVVLAHLLALQQLPAVLAPPDLATTRAFITRSIVVQPPPAPVIQAPAPATAPPAPPPVPRKRRVAPAPVEPPAPAVAAAEAPDSPPTPLAAPEPALAEPAPTVAAGPPTEPAQTESAEAAEPETLTAEPPGQAASAPAPAASPDAPAAPPDALALAIPGSVRLKYTLTGESKQMAYHAFGELLWLQDGQTYDARLEYSAFLIGARVRTSSGRLTARGLQPARFSDAWRKRNLVARFERDTGQVSFSAGTPAAALLPDVQDQLSVLLQLASQVAGDPGRHVAGSNITVPVVGPRDADVWTFTLQGEELVYLPYDNVQALKLIRNPRRPNDQKVEAWLAPSLAYMPVQVRITLPNGDFVEQKLRSVEPP